MRISYWSSDVCSSDLADAKERRAAFQHLRDEVDFLADEGQVVVVGAHRAAEDHAAGMVFEGVGQFLAKAGTADVEMVAARPQLFADTAGVGTFLMDDYEDGGLGHTGHLQRSLVHNRFRGS